MILGMIILEILFDYNKSTLINHKSTIINQKGLMILGLKDFRIDYFRNFIRL
ncbi:MAG: hypothetical protein Fur0015_10540 [Ignavibacteriales bacterium]